MGSSADARVDGPVAGAAGPITADGGAASGIAADGVAAGGGAEDWAAVLEDTIDLGERLDPVRTLLRRASAGDQRAARALVEVLGPRIHGLALHVTGSGARAERLTVEVLRSCLREAAELAASGLPGEAAVLDRARRAAVATRPSGVVRSLLSPDRLSPGSLEDRTRDRREVEMLRVLLALPPGRRAMVEAAAQGRLPYAGLDRQQAALALAQFLDALVPLRGSEEPEIRALASLDALALADPGERRRLAELTRAPDTAGIHRHAIEAAARLTRLTALAPSRDLHLTVLEGFAPQPPASRPRETAYAGDYATPVLGTDRQRRQVGPLALAGTLHASAPPADPAAPTGMPLAAAGGDPSATPTFAFRPGDELLRTRRGRRQARRLARQQRLAARGGRGVPWLSRSLAVLLALTALVLGGLLLDARSRLGEAEDFAATWADLTMVEDAALVHGASDNGLWQAVLTPGGLAVRADGVAPREGEVLELWGESDGQWRSLGVLDLEDDGTVRFSTDRTAERLQVTWEMAPGSGSGSPSPRVVASLAPSAEEG